MDRIERVLGERQGASSAKDRGCDAPPTPDKEQPWIFDTGHQHWGDKKGEEVKDGPQPCIGGICGAKANAKSPRESQGRGQDEQSGREPRMGNAEREPDTRAECARKQAGTGGGAREREADGGAGG